MIASLIPITFSLFSSASVIQSVAPLLPGIDPNREDIFFGYYISDTENVNSLTLVQVSESDIDFIQSTGREVGYYWYQGRKTHYYFADENHPKIVNIAPIYDDMDSYIFMVGQVEQRLRELAFTVSEPEQMNNYVLGYLRGFNKNYWAYNVTPNWSAIIHSYWGVAAGECLSPSLTGLLESDGTRGFKLNEYFRRFVGRNEYACDYHEESSFDISDPSLVFEKNIPDPFGSAHSIDMPHMFAVADGYYADTEQNDLAIAITHIYKYNIVDLCSWAGDLHSRVKEMILHPSSDDFFHQHTIDSLFRGEFSYADLLADIDGCNFARMYLNDGYLVSEALAEYYDVLYNVSTVRYDRFVTTVWNHPDGYGNTGTQWTGTIKEQFYRELYYSLGIEITGFNNDGPVGQEGPSRNTFLMDYYHIMGGVNMAELNDRIDVAKYFADYLFGNVNPVLRNIWSV